MAVLKFKSHRLYYYDLSEGYEDDNGDYHKGEQTINPRPLECDAVPAGKADERTFEDGKVRKYSFTCYLKPNVREFQIGEKVRLERHGKTYEFEVKGYMPYQHQTKVWVG